ncbi:hypothetical protein KVT40_004275 [Elsinoe batatas]|uniref:Uncharacterized protein n=1 Tax=Elsinoe batatas TaxID=2601811 RepID=A0A8K0L3F1_9PEZI|nr:hypothetical protein KVT40_004275 [Elsinoe batatas]
MLSEIAPDITSTRWTDDEESKFHAPDYLSHDHSCNLYSICVSDACHGAVYEILVSPFKHGRREQIHFEFECTWRPCCPQAPKAGLQGAVFRKCEQLSLRLTQTGLWQPSESSCKSGFVLHYADDCMNMMENVLSNCINLKVPLKTWSPQISSIKPTRKGSSSPSKIRRISELTNEVLDGPKLTGSFLDTDVILPKLVASELAESAAAGKLIDALWELAKRTSTASTWYFKFCAGCLISIYPRSDAVKGYQDRFRWKAVAEYANRVVKLATPDLGPTAYVIHKILAVEARVMGTLQRMTQSERMIAAQNVAEDLVRRRQTGNPQWGTMTFFDPYTFLASNMNIGIARLSKGLDIPEPPMIDRNDNWNMLQQHLFPTSMLSRDPTREASPQESFQPTEEGVQISEREMADLMEVDPTSMMLLELDPHNPINRTLDYDHDWPSGDIDISQYLS